jgi:hypothetical protein
MKNNKNVIKRTIKFNIFALLFICLIFIIVGIVWFMFGIKQREHLASKIQSAKPINNSTGEVREIIKAVELPLNDQIVAFEKYLPLTQSTFSIQADLRNGVYKVILQKPYVQAKQDFYDWMTQNGFASMSADLFTFIADNTTEKK